jgi:acyl-CoA reductase-like NAD-dependent aldehyde dehydrogenase
LANLLEKHKPELARLIALEVAKPIDRAEVEVSRSIQLAKNYASRAREVADKEQQRRDMVNGHGVYQSLRPLGPVLAYTPFNFPLNLVMHKLAPAIGAGTSIVIKPSPRCPITSLYLAKLCSDAGYKAVSVVNLNNEQARTLVQNPTFKIFSFTGAPNVGFMLKDLSKAEKNVLELGNNSPLILEDVQNKGQLKEIAQRAALFKFSYAGQTCIAVQRILINEKLYPDFLKHFEATLKDIKMGNVLDQQTVLGPMIDRQAAERTQQWVAEALSKGAKLLGPDQDRNRIVQPGWFKPTVLVDTTPDMDVNRKEVFAPIVTITPYKTFKEGVALANASDFALHTGLYTQSRKKVDYARRNLDATGLNVNEVPTYRDDRLAYGGTKLSGIGVEGSDVGIEDYSRIVYTDINEHFGKK